MTSSFKTKRLVESALMIALSAILSFIILFRLPFGGLHHRLLYAAGDSGLLPLWSEMGICDRLCLQLDSGYPGHCRGYLQRSGAGRGERCFQRRLLLGQPAAGSAWHLPVGLHHRVYGAGHRRHLPRQNQKQAAGSGVRHPAGRSAAVCCPRYFGRSSVFGIWGEWFFTQEGFFAWGQTLVDMFPGKTLYVLYSLIYNLFFLLPEVGLTALAGFLIAKAMPKLLQSQQADRVNKTIIKRGAAPKMVRLLFYQQSVCLGKRKLLRRRSGTGRCGCLRRFGSCG